MTKQRKICDSTRFCQVKPHTVFNLVCAGSAVVGCGCSLSGERVSGAVMLRVCVEEVLEEERQGEEGEREGQEWH